MSESAFNFDGMTREAYISPTKGLHPACRFSYRPVLSWERDELLTDNGRMKPREKALNTAKFLAGKIVSWDLRGSDGKVAPVSAENLMRLQAVLQDRVYSILYGLEYGDDDPDKPPTDGEQSERLEERLFGSAHGLTPGTAAEVLAEKKL